MVFKYGVILLVAAVCGTSAMPPCVCTRNYRPVCGSNDQTYPNECMLNCARATNNDLTLVHKGTCAQPTCICTFEYKPICGSDGSTYSNECALNCQRNKNPILERRYEGPCRSEEVKVAELPELSELPACACTRELRPVCGTDGETYSNPCLLRCNAQTKTDLTMKYFGPCEGDDEVRVVEQPPPSSCSCTRNFQPVCGTDGVTYSNPCLLRCSAHSNTDLTMDHFGPCDQNVDQVKVVEQPLPSTCSCTRNLQPVCGTDGVTYNNPCLLRCAAQNKPLTLKAVGPCDDSNTVNVVELPKTPAGCVCTRNYMPVCGSDGKTYPNPCMLGCATNQNPDLKMFHVGPCSENLQVDVVENPVF